MMKKKSHPEFVRALKARNLKITVVGTYENCLSRVAVRCDVCGWEYDEEQGYPEGGIAPGTKWEDVPEDFECPLCSVGKDQFSPE